MALERARHLIHGILSAGLLGIGVTVMVLLLKSNPAPPVRSSIGQVPSVAISLVEPTEQQPPIIGFGTIRPKEQVKIIPQVSGKLVFAHKDLAVGKVIPAAELLYEIDSTVYEARVHQVEAEIRGLQASLARQDQEGANLDERLANANKILAIAESDFRSSKSLFDQNAGTKVQMDQAEEKYLTRIDTVSELKSRRALIPHLKLETQAQLEASLARLSQARYNLDATKIFCPFRARVEAVGARESQVVTAHLSITTLTNMEAFELSVGIDPRQLRWLDHAIQPGALGREESGWSPEVPVVWSLSGQEFTWRAHVTRFERVEERTRTAQMVLEIREADMVASVQTGSSDAAPTLSIGMHCKAELPAAPLNGALVIPRRAVYDDHWVYVYETDHDASAPSVGHLARRRVPILRGIGDDVLVDFQGRDDGQICELQPGDLVVVSPLIKPVVGMKITCREQRISNTTALSRLARYRVASYGHVPALILDSGVSKGEFDSEN